MADYRATEQALEDLADIWEYISVQGSIDIAESQNQRFYQRFLLLAEQPYMGRARPELAPNLRSFPVGSYLIIYRPADYGVQIVRVIHGSRDIEGLFEP